jgi:hypothetical protein
MRRFLQSGFDRLAKEPPMKTILKIAAATVFIVTAGTTSALAACNGDASTETVLGSGSGALVGGLASHSIAGAAIGGVAGGLIGNAIGHSNNREDCRRDAYYDYGSDNYAYQGNSAYYPDGNRDQGYFPDTNNYAYQGNQTYYPDANRYQGYYPATNRDLGHYPDANRGDRVDRQGYDDPNSSDYNQ